jgi:hypothetical protein
MAAASARRTPDDRAEIEAGGQFEDVEVRNYVWERSYAADEYFALLDTFSGQSQCRPRNESTSTKRFDSASTSAPTGE